MGKCVFEKRNTPASCDTLDRGGGRGKTEDIEIETFSADAEQTQGTATEETEEYYFQDPTTIGKIANTSTQGNTEANMYMFSM